MNKRLSLFVFLATIVLVGGYYVGKNQLYNNQAATINSGVKSDISLDKANAPICTSTTPPYIKIVNPNGGQLFQVGQQLAIQWTSCNIPTSGVPGSVLSVGISNSLGIQSIPFSTMIGTNNYYGTINDGSESITIPSSLLTGNDYKIFLKASYLTGQPTDYSDMNFTIQAPVIMGQYIPQFLFSPISTANIINGTKIDLYKFSIKAPNHAVAFKRITLPVTWSDGGSSDTLSLSNFQLFKNGADITSQVMITNEIGDPLSTSFVNSLTESNTSVIINSGAFSELLVPANTTIDFLVKAVPHGFHLNNADPVKDVFTIKLVGDLINQGNNTKVTYGDFATCPLYNGPANAYLSNIGLCVWSLGTLVNFNIIWSDIKENGHSPNSFPPVSSNDWLSGYKLIGLPLQVNSFSK